MVSLPLFCVPKVPGIEIDNCLGSQKKVIWQRLFARHATNCLPSNTKYDIIRNREKDSVLPMFGHTKEASVLWHWSLFILFGKNTPNRVASAREICDTLICKHTKETALVGQQND